MKKTLLFSIFALLTSLSVSAQCTADPQYVDPGVYPDEATTIVWGISLTFVFDSVVISDWTGLPPGFTYACLSPNNTQSPIDNCSFEGGQTGCIQVTGTPALADIGSYQQIITTDAYLQGNPNGNPSEVIVDYYYIQVVDCGLSVPALTNSKFLVYPNPAKSKVTLNGLNGIDVESILVTDMEGKVLESYENVIGPALDMDIDYLQSGMYFVTINYNGTSEVVKFIKE